MQLNLKSFQQIVTDQAQVILASSNKLIDFAIGSVLRAMAESNAGIVMWLQSLILKLLSNIRASTSSGADLDTWFADFGFVRRQALQASGNVVFSRATATVQSIVPVNVTVQTVDGAVSFTVIVDTTNPDYDSNLNGYVAAVGEESITVPVECTVGGIVGNVAANTINLITTPIVGIDTVNNPLTFVNGEDQESDVSARQSFVLWLAALAKANYASISYAIRSIKGVANYFLHENTDLSGNVKLGFFYGIIDDGTNGVISPSLINTVRNSVDQVRGFTIRFDIYGRTIVTVNVAASIIVDTGYTFSDMSAAATTAIQTYINSVEIGSPLRYTRIAQIIYNASPGIIDVTSVTINGATADILVSNTQAVKSGTITITQV